VRRSELKNIWRNYLLTEQSPSREAANWCWSSPAQSLSGPSPAVLITIFYCPRFETPPTWRVTSPYLCPPVTGWPVYTPKHWVLFVSSYDWRGYGGSIRLRLYTGKRPQFLLNNIYKFSSYLTGNTLPLRYKAQPFNAV
jgi:hypothetical protein